MVKTKMLPMLEIITAVLRMNGYELIAPLELRSIKRATKVVRDTESRVMIKATRVQRTPTRR